MAMAAINNPIESAEHYSRKRQLLAIVAADYSSTVLRAHFPIVTDFQIKAARKYHIFMVRKHSFCRTI